MLEFLGLVLLFMLIRLCFPFRSAEEKRQRREAAVPPLRGVVRAMDEMRDQRWRSIQGQGTRYGARVLDLDDDAPRKEK